ncbi:MAG: hypothetical protein J6L64_08455 [Opitutales bacterium]|nr:hypothetical protein [Opitutales bacterium]
MKILGLVQKRRKERYLQNFNNLLKKPTRAQCREALFLLGKISHAWQDYYGHAVALNRSGYLIDTNSVGTIDPSSSPANTDPNVVPSSYGSWIDGGQHGEIFIPEPGNRAPDSEWRYQESINYTAQQYEIELKKWNAVCLCLFKEWEKNA